MRLMKQLRGSSASFEDVSGPSSGPSSSTCSDDGGISSDDAGSSTTHMSGSTSRGAFTMPFAADAAPCYLVVLDGSTMGGDDVMAQVCVVGAAAYCQ